MCTFNRLQTKLRESNVFTGVSLSTGSDYVSPLDIPTPPLDMGSRIPSNYYRHLVAVTKKRTVDKHAVPILLECFLVILRENFSINKIARAFFNLNKPTDISRISRN